MTTIVCHDSILVIALAMELMTTVNWEHDVIWMLYYVEHRSQQSGITVVLYVPELNMWHRYHSRFEIFRMALFLLTVHLQLKNSYFLPLCVLVYFSLLNSKCDGNFNFCRYFNFQQVAKNHPYKFQSNFHRTGMAL